jgi:outer membrane protein OmpA-like peptidoglycan-associated protein
VNNGAVTYTPDVAFRGVDEFTYTVSDGVGRTASATVTVTVANAAPTAVGATLAQVAGTVARVRIHARDLNGDPLSLTVAHNPAAIPVTVNGLRVRLAPPATLTGRARITFLVHDGAGGTTRVNVLDTVRPQPVASARRTLSTAGTHITWSKASATGAKYRVLIGRRVACVTSALSCDTARLLGPAVHVWVRVLGHDSTVSTRTAVTPAHKAKVVVGIVYFASGSWTLDAAQRARLARLAHRLTRNGFTRVQLNGYTDAVGGRQYNLHLSHQRTQTIAHLLAGDHLASRQSWFGKANPAVPGRSAAKNRRVEILVS